MTNLDAALAYAQRGWRVIPIPPGHKHPKGYARWQEIATTETAQITTWWTANPDHGIGIATGPGSGIWVLDVDVADAKRGDDALAELEATHGPLPDTYEVITGTGGRHIYFAWNPAREVRNNQSGAIANGIDTRGDGGFVVAPPSIHPNGQPYALDLYASDEIAAAPDWLYDLLDSAASCATGPEPAPMGNNMHTAGGWETVRPDAGEAPGDLWAASVTWGQLLAADGWTLHHADRDGTEHWTRPGKDRREGTSATVGYGGSDVLKVFTSSLGHMGLHPEATYTKFGYYAATRHHGDHGAAARELRAQGWRASPSAAPSLPPGAASGPHDGQDATVADPGDWEPLDLTAVVSGAHEAPTPTILTPFGGTPLFYEGRTNSIFGESGAGKTWIELAAIVEVLNAGGVAGLIDLEDTSHGIVSRLRLLGVADDVILARFLYWSPSSGWDDRAAAAVAKVIAERQPRLVCIDSTGEAMAAGGVKGNDDDDVARWFVRFPKMIARLGPAVVIVDHVPKDPNAPVGFAIGSQRKIAAIDGAAYRVDAVKVPSKTDDGLLKVTTAKDRHGNHTKGKKAAEVTIEHTGAGGVLMAVSLPEATPTDEAGHFRPTVLMERISTLLEGQDEAKSQNWIMGNLQGKTEHKRTALGALVAEGYVSMTPAGRGFQYASERPFRQSADYTESARGDVPPDDIDQHRPTSTFHMGGAVPDRPRPLAPPPTGAGARSRAAQDPQIEATAPRTAPPAATTAAIDPFDILEEDF